MIFGNCNLKITNLYPRLDRNDLGDYYFSVGIKKEFAKKCFEKELTEEGHNNLQRIGESMIKKTWGNPDLFSRPPYNFFENSKGNLTCLIRNLTVPGNACGLDYHSNSMHNIEDELNDIREYNNFIELQPHNIDCPTQCYEFLSLLTSWEEIMDSQFWKIN